MIDKAKQSVAKVKKVAKQQFKAPAPIVPPANLSSKALIVVVIIMSFLACLTLGFVTLIQETSKTWQNQISEEITIQIKPEEGRDMELALLDAKSLALEFSGTLSAEIVDKADTARLLEPWLGEGFDMDELPVPRLLIITIDKDNPPDFDSMRKTLADTIPNAYLDDHRTWAGRLVSMAQNTVFIGVGLLSLVLVATTLTVVFATRGAMSVNHEIIEVLHFVGAESSFVANEFQKHFLLTGFYGGAIGGGLAAFVFFITDIWQGASMATALNDQASALFGSFSMGPAGYLGIAIIIVTVAILTALTTRITVIKTIREIDIVRSDPARSDLA
jgi:cell division transport system permease protein